MLGVHLVVGMFLHLGSIRRTAIDRYQFQTSRTALEEDLIDPFLALFDFALSIDLFGKSQLGIGVARPGLGVRLLDAGDRVLDHFSSRKRRFGAHHGWST